MAQPRTILGGNVPLSQFSPDVVSASRRMETGMFMGPVSYPAGGFTVDLSDKFSKVDFITISIDGKGSTTVPVNRFEMIYQDSQVNIKVFQMSLDAQTLSVREIDDNTDLSTLSLRYMAEGLVKMKEI